MYFLRIDYIYKCSPVQRVRLLVHGLRNVRRELARYIGDDFMVLAARIERCH